MRLVAIISLLLLIGAPKAWSAFFDGNAIYDRCTSRGPANADFCLGYAAGAADMLMRLHGMGGWTQALNDVCLPEGVTLAQVRDVIVQALSNKPETRHQQAPDLVLPALASKFSCYSEKR